MLHCLEQLSQQFSFSVLNTMLPTFTKISPEKVSYFKSDCECQRANSYIQCYRGL